jgi:predicted kinase
MKMKQTKVFLLSGIPGSGKSTWARKNLTPTTEWISRDNVRFSIVREDEEYFSHEDEVFDTFISYINQMLEDPRVDTIFIDATHLNKKSRDKTLNRIRKEKISELNCVCFITPLNICQERNKLRSGRSVVPETVIDNMFKAFSLPDTNENFTNVFMVDENGDCRRKMDV